MQYYIIDSGNNQSGPFSIDELKTKDIKTTTKVWCQGMNDWSEAGKVESLKELFSLPPLINIPPPIQTNQNNHYRNFVSNLIYDEGFDLNTLSQDEINRFKRNTFSETFSAGVGILLHFLTLGLFTLISCGIKHSMLPKIKSDDFGTGKAIGYLFIHSLIYIGTSYSGDA